MQKSELVPCDDPLADLLQPETYPPPTSPPSKVPSRTSTPPPPPLPTTTPPPSSPSPSTLTTIPPPPTTTTTVSTPHSGTNIGGAAHVEIYYDPIKESGASHADDEEDGVDWSDVEDTSFVHSIYQATSSKLEFRLEHLWNTAAKQKPAVDLEKKDYLSAKASGNQSALLRLSAQGSGYLPGETLIMKVPQVLHFSFSGRMSAGTMYMTNFRMHFVPDDEMDLGFRKRFLSVPLTFIEKFEQPQKKVPSESGKVLFTLRDFRTLTFIFPWTSVGKVLDRIEQFAFPLSSNFDSFFAFEYHKALRESNSLPIPIPSLYDGWKIYDPFQEYTRLGIFQRHNAELYFMTDINVNYRLCDSYPKYLVLPKGLSRVEIEHIAEFRTKERIPCLVWKHPNCGATLWRCSQPKVGIKDSRSSADEKFFKLLSARNADNRLVYIADARPRINAYGNKVTGAGFEDTQIYNSCELDFLNIQNIHAIRESYQKLSRSCSRLVSGPSYSESSSSNHYNWYAQVDGSQWLLHIAEVLKATFTMVYKIDCLKATVVSHCSDGWDRTSQLCSLTELCIDPYFRTIRGFFVLIEKEWVSFGHKFNQRLGYGHKNSSDDQRSPIFVQWVDCVYQLTHEFPSAFEFNSTLLVTLLDEIYSCRFGTFLRDNQCQRESYNFSNRTVSIWTYFLTCHVRARFLNPFYDGNQYSGSSKVLYPSYNFKKLKIWEDYWYRWAPSETLHGGIGPGSATKHGAVACSHVSSNRFIEIQHLKLKQKLKKAFYSKVNASPDANEVVHSNDVVEVDYQDIDAPNSNEDIIDSN